MVASPTRKWMALFTGLLTVLGVTCAGTGTVGETVSPIGPKLLCTTFSIYQVTRNVTRGREGLTLDLLLPAGLGCPHDYMLTPQDMHRISAAQVLVVNGLGMEEFLGAPVRQANDSVVVIDSSRDMTPLHHEAGRGEHPAGPNPHVFASPRLSGQQARTVAAALARIDPGGAEVYARNAAAYAARMEMLASEFEATGKALKNRRIAAQHEVFDYMARDLGLEIVAVIQVHPGLDPSAADMIEIVKTIRMKKAGAVFTEPQYSPEVGRTLAREAGIPVVTVDPVATGPADAGLEYYDMTMRANLEAILKALGTKGSGY